MTDWRSEFRTCACGKTFKPKREGQRHCCSNCRVKEAKARYRSDTRLGSDTGLPRSVTTPTTGQSAGLCDGPTMVWPELDFHHGPTPGALQGDDVELDYYEDGYPILPACLDRRRKPKPLAKAA